MNKCKMAVIGALLLALLSGCGVPAMTAEDEQRIVNYAANVALKYDGNYRDRLVDLSKYDTPLPEMPPVEEEESTGMDPVEDTDTIDVSGGQGPVSSIDEFYGLEGFAIDFADYQTCKTYPDDSADDLYFSLEATAGKTLLVLKFQITNESAQSAVLDMLSLKPVLRLQINGERNVGVMQTMLLDDIVSYKGTLAAGESIDLVLLAQIEESYEGNITQIALNMRKSDASESQKLILLQ